jgi:diguanylate cyclase (GGDEF)-like protein
MSRPTRPTTVTTTSAARSRVLGEEFAVPRVEQSILIVDDDILSIKLLQAAFGDSYTILTATSGRDAIEIAVAQCPDLILLDAMLPDIDGFEVCRSLKVEERTTAIPIIFITGLDAKEQQRRALELGAIDFISKPIDLTILTLRIRNHLELKLYRDFLENLTLLDSLTGIYNRRAFDEILEREWRRGRRSTTPLSLLIADVDFFKRYNDLYGHPQGDGCLRQVAEVLATTVHRPNDTVARYGGEEFAIILPETDHTGAHQLAETLRERIQSQAIPHEEGGSWKCVTVSIGVATLVPDDTTKTSALVQQADEHLYRAKEAGRNRVC